MEIFENDEMAVDFSKKTIDLANTRHNREKNPDDMVKVYEEILYNER